MDLDLKIGGHNIAVRDVPNKDYIIISSPNADAITVFREFAKDNIGGFFPDPVEAGKQGFNFKAFLRAGLATNPNLPGINPDSMGYAKVMQAIAQHINTTFPTPDALHTEAEKIRGTERAKKMHQMDQQAARVDHVARMRTTGLAAFIDAMVDDMLKKAEQSGNPPAWTDEYKNTLRDELARWYKLEQQRAARERN